MLKTTTPSSTASIQTTSTSKKPPVITADFTNLPARIQHLYAAMQHQEVQTAALNDEVSSIADILLAKIDGKISLRRTPVDKLCETLWMQHHVRYYHPSQSRVEKALPAVTFVSKAPAKTTAQFRHERDVRIASTENAKEERLLMKGERVPVEMRADTLWCENHVFGEKTHQGKMSMAQAPVSMLADTLWLERNVKEIPRSVPVPAW